MSRKISGSLHVANDVIADIAGNAALECYGVVGMSSQYSHNGLVSLLPASRLRRGVVVSDTPTGAHVDLYVIIEYGTNINVVSKNLKDQVTFALKKYATTPIEGVEVHVKGVKVRNR